MSEPLLLTTVLLIALIAGMIQGTIGFGFVLVAAPLMSIFVDPKLLVPAVIVQTLATSVPILLHPYRTCAYGACGCWRWLAWRAFQQGRSSCWCWTPRLCGCS
ncbi:MAG: hypothetical protein O2783_00985 [Chloroflexi bacterium]|nr:hypothetical protein [Chloroflexota bacterium]